MYADQAVENTVNAWLERRAFSPPTTEIQKESIYGGPLLAKRYASHYKGTRISTDGTTIFSYKTPLLTTVKTANGYAIEQSPYFKNGEYSKTTARQIAIIKRILTAKGLAKVAGI